MLTKSSKATYKISICVSDCSVDITFYYRSLPVIDY